MAGCLILLFIRQVCSWLGPCVDYKLQLQNVYLPLLRYCTAVLYKYSTCTVHACASGPLLAVGFLQGSVLRRTVEIKARRTFYVICVLNMCRYGDSVRTGLSICIYCIPACRLQVCKVQYTGEGAGLKRPSYKTYAAFLSRSCHFCIVLANVQHAV